MVRAGDDNELADVIEKKQAVAIGWAAMNNVSSLKTRDEFKEAYRKAFPDDTESQVAMQAGQIYRFVHEIQQNHYILSCLKASRELLIGICDGPYEHTEKLFSNYYPQIRGVKWLNRVSRDDFSEPARAALGRPPTVFQLDDHLSEIHRLATAKLGMSSPPPAEDRAEPPFHTEVEAKAAELIADLISKLAPTIFKTLSRRCCERWIFVQRVNRPVQTAG